MWICLLVAEIENTAWEARKGNDMVAAGTLSLRMSTTQEEAVGHAWYILRLDNVTQRPGLRVSSTKVVAEAIREDEVTQRHRVASERTLPKYLMGYAKASLHPQPEQEIKRPLAFWLYWR